MARPAYSQGDATATERLKDAFWEMLSQMPYPKIGVRGLLRQTGFSKNTFYYHFENMDELADEAIGDMLLTELGQAVISSHGISSAPFTDALAKDESKLKLKRLSLLLGSNGDALSGKAVERLARTWEEMFAAQGDMDQDTRMMMRFLAGGVVGMLHGKSADEIPATLNDLKMLPGLQACVDSLLK